MNLQEFNRAIAAIEPPDGDGYHVRVHFSGGWIDGAHRAPRDGAIEIDPYMGGECGSCALIELAAIVKIERMPE